MTVSPATSDLYVPLVVEFNEASSSLPACGAISYEVIDLATSAPLIINTQVINTGVAPATLTLLSANKADTEAPKEIAIRATQANVAFVDSEEFVIQLVDPCLSTVV